jgi:hypothetical protein
MKIRCIDRCHKSVEIVHSCMQALDCVFAASAITAICCACINALLKSAYRSECIDGHYSEISSVARPTAISSIVAAALSLLASAAVIFKSRSNGAWVVAAAIFSKWQPLYFIVVSAQRIILRLVVICKVDDTCLLTGEGHIHVEAATFMWDCTILSTGMFAIAGDMQADHTPTRRRCIYCFLALCLLVDTTGSYIWGNSMASQVSVSLGFIEFFLDNQITSSVTSQVIIALHFLFVSCRSRSGRGWAYASLRFELDRGGKASLSKRASTGLNETHQVSEIWGAATSASSRLLSLGSPELSAAHNISSGSSIIGNHDVVAPFFESEHKTNAKKNEAAIKSTVFSRLRQRVLLFQKRHLLRCRAFVIPRVANHDAQIGTDIEFVMARPAFDFRFLRPLQRLADAHPKSYIIFSFWFLIIPTYAFRLFLRDPAKGISSLFGNLGIFIMLLGYLSSRRHGLDRVAVKHVTLSFRFAMCVVFIAQWIALSIRDSYIGRFHPTQILGDVFLNLIFFGCALLDCSPHLSTSSQIVVTVTLS